MFNREERAERRAAKEAKWLSMFEQSAIFRVNQ